MMVQAKLQPFPKQALVFTCLQYKSLKAPREKEKLLIMSNFSFSHGVFYHTFRFFHQILYCCLQIFQFEKVENLPFGKGLTRNVIQNGKVIMLKWKSESLGLAYHFVQWCKICKVSQRYDVTHKTLKTKILCHLRVMELGLQPCVIIQHRFVKFQSF